MPTADSQSSLRSIMSLALRVLAMSHAAVPVSSGGIDATTWVGLVLWVRSSPLVSSISIFTGSKKLTSGKGRARVKLRL